MNQSINSIHRKNGLEWTLLKIENKARDRLLLIEFNEELKSNVEMKIENVPQQYLHLIYQDYITGFETDALVLDENFENASYRTVRFGVKITDEGQKLLNSPTYMFLSIFARYF